MGLLLQRLATRKSIYASIWYFLDRNKNFCWQPLVWLHNQFRNSWWSGLPNLDISGKHVKCIFNFFFLPRPPLRLTAYFLTHLMRIRQTCLPSRNFRICPWKKEKRERVPENTELCFLSLKYPIDVFICRTFVLFDVVWLFFIILCVFAVSNTFSISIYKFLNKSSDFKVERDDRMTRLEL